MSGTLVVGSVAIDSIFTISPSFKSELPLTEGHLDKVNMTFVADDSEFRPGGTATNIVYSYLLLGKKVYLFSAVGNDFDHLMGDRLKEMGLHDRTVRFDQQTAQSVQISDKDADQMIIWQPNAYANIGNTDITDTMSEDEIRQCSYAIFAPGSPVSTSRHMRLFSELNPDAYVIFDPGQMINHYSQDQMLTCLDMADMLILNDVELLKIKEGFAMMEGDILSKVSTIIVTRGPLGVDIINNDGTTKIPVDQEIEAVESTGAGDAFRGAMLAALQQGEDLQTACMVANVVASKSVEHLGAQLHEVSWEEIRRRI